MQKTLQPKAPSAFTLIELLIVVAIIAILAAIAVPNFLEAQTRAKVSRAKNDIRTLTTALESYAVDNRKYPFDRDAESTWYMTDVISTPIAYLTTGQLIDPFRPKGGPSAANLKLSRFRYVHYEANRAANSWKTCYLPAIAGSATAIAASSDAACDAGINAFGMWKISSSGPDFNANTGFFAEQLFYDATNGTVSTGDIIRAQKQGQL